MRVEADSVNSHRPTASASRTRPKMNSVRPEACLRLSKFLRVARNVFLFADGGVARKEAVHRQAANDYDAQQLG
jgi:hypothetical protein